MSVSRISATTAVALLLAFGAAACGDDGGVTTTESGPTTTATATAYTEGGKSFGGFKLEPTAVTITGDEAEVTYDVYFGTNPQYTDQKGGAVLVEGVWTVKRSEFCGFMASARTPCPA